MERFKRFLPAVGILIVIGAYNLYHFGQNVTSVEAVGLAGSGFALGVAFILIVFGFKGRIK